MRKILVHIGRKSYRCDVPETREEMHEGLMGKENLPKDEGMLFDFSEIGEPTMWMKDTKIPLDMIGISEDWEVIQKETPKPMSEDLIHFPNCIYIVELNKGSKVKIGDDFEIDDEIDIEKYKMKVLAPDGTAQMLLQGGERIFSRISTRKLIAKAKRAYADRKDKDKYEKDCIKLGEYVFKELWAQNHRDKEYVEIPDDEEE